jgi:glycosyltransferase involved in cell wall biosynthesis
MKILLFNEYTSIAGGIDYTVDLEYQYLRKRGTDVKLFSFSNSLFHEASLEKKLTLIYKSLRGEFQLEDFQNCINEYEPDIIHFHNVYQLFRTPVWTRIDTGRAKIIIHLHNYYPFCINSFFYRDKRFCTDCLQSNNWIPAIVHKCYNNSYLQSCMVSAARMKPHEWIKSVDKVIKLISVSKYTSEIFMQSGVPEDKIVILPNAVEKSQYEDDKTKDYILFLGNIRTEKGIDLVCKAACDNHNIKFIIAGDGPDLKRYQSKYSMVNNLEFKGYVTGSVKAGLLVNARFLIVTSLCAESFSIVTLEAFAAGTPVLSSGRGAAGEHIQEGITGRYLTEHNASEEIGHYWDELDKDYEYYSKNCKRYAEKYYADMHIDRLLNIYNNAL